ncbi:AAA family ATPase [Pseudoramibacter sp.]|uniref:AAA family ATPase n=1 Tax=Pseudoramibacter sp. TaxID=2034862 RepID=UPI0025D23E3E|nr:AAA family ATPase [Pseudoramibacter sp.]MCH4072052.1 AAA family ATPase [Pseudoramibacter sp.]MCH4105821.1 AAA family ATPase [Pseudoramibacter sp.]
MKFKPELQQALANLFKARFPYVYMPTWEELRAEAFVQSIAEDEALIRHVRTVYTWTQTDGLVRKGDGQKIAGTADPIKALEWIEKCDENAVFVMKDMHIYFGVPGRPVATDLVRKMRDLIPSLHNSEARKNVVLISPHLVIPGDMEKEITVFDFPLPDVAEIEDMMDRIVAENALDPHCITPEEKEKLAKSALGLTLQEAENAFSRAIVANHGLDINALPVIFDEKNQVIKKTGILEFVKSDLTIDDIGGLDNLKSWLLKRKNSWLDAAKKYNIPAPKGVLITGIPGCGKSLTAKAMSTIWNLPLLKLDMGKIFSGIVGSSEENMRRAIETAEAVAPSILWVDEIEKGLAGVNGNGDSGTSTRVFGTFLTWMQEKTAPVFVVATANQISTLPTELLRKGRFDEIFFVDLPTASERKKIFEVHLNKRVAHSEVGRDLPVDDALLTRLSQASRGFVGAEIEQAVITALYEAFFHQRGLKEEDLMYAIRGTVPLSVTQKEQILALRRWADVRAVSATPKEDLETYKQPLPPDDDTEAPPKKDDVNAQRGGRMLDF